MCYVRLESFVIHQLFDYHISFCLSSTTFIKHEKQKIYQGNFWHGWVMPFPFHSWYKLHYHLINQQIVDNDSRYLMYLCISGIAKDFSRRQILQFELIPKYVPPSNVNGHKSCCSMRWPKYNHHSTLYVISFRDRKDVRNGT